MADTARFLKANLKREDQAIVLTGSMMPLSGFDKSDASFNLGYAVSKVQALDKGIYLGMNGQLLLPEEVMKFISEGKFISIFQDKQ
jgi:L-asparaginase